jgi:hypothetical protein
MSTLHNPPLPKPLRTQLENTVKAARDVAEVAATAALVQLAVGEGKAPDYLTDDQKALRRRLRAHGRALGDVKAADDSQSIRHLVWETAYEHWHRMLFARFLAENGLLLWEPGAPVTLAECEEMAQDPATSLGAKSGWDLAGMLAARMLPQVFKPQHPVFDMAFAIEHQRKLESLLAALPDEVFKASDSLGWVYQFWQAKRKDEVNASEVKIGADELPAVTQLFTEPYMVDFLLHNSLGAWWTTRHPGKTCPVPLTYLRTLDDGTPAAGKFEGWPDTLEKFKLLDPCCGSGHFLVAAFLLLVPMRMAAEGLTAMDAVDLVLQDNLHGLELDARCVEIAVFALALTAWRFPDENGDPLGVRADMPAPNIACCGLKVAAMAEDWMALVPDDAPNAAYLRQELRLLHASFAQAPLLGSLLDPARGLKNDLATSSFHTLRELLANALAAERPATLWGQASELQDDSWDLALTAKGMLDSARLLDGRYHLVATNYPFLGTRKQSGELREYCEAVFPDSKHDLSSCMIERSGGFLGSGGILAFVSPQNWYFLGAYKGLRKHLLSEFSWGLIAALGSKSFQTPMYDFSIALTILTKDRPSSSQETTGINVEGYPTPEEKSDALRKVAPAYVRQAAQLKNPDQRITLVEASGIPLLQERAICLTGAMNGDSGKFVRFFWEFEIRPMEWVHVQSTVSTSLLYGGREQLLYFDAERGHLREDASVRRERLHNSDERGKAVWGKKGVLVHRMGNLPATIYSGDVYDQNGAVIAPKPGVSLEAIWCYLTSSGFVEEVRKLDNKVGVTPATLAKVPFDSKHWSDVAAREFPNGLPKPYSDDPTQWLFHGHPRAATDPLQVAVSRLAGYRWPAETEASMELSDEARTWIAYCEKLAENSDDDGIICLPSVRGEPAAHDRLLKLLIAAWETVQPGSWKPAVLNKLLTDADWAGKGLDTWLREKFFEQHAKRFHHRPFIWHVWDGLKDGFGALVNYHKLDTKNLERLIHTYLGDWIRQQEGGVRDGVDGAPTRLAAALDLKRRLELILEGEKPYDIFVRWKPLAEQPIGWNPDLNDGVRMNIRPFMTAEVLRHNKKPKLNITWDKDRGKDVESAPWFHKFEGDRINDHHLSLAEKKAARKP